MVVGGGEELAVLLVSQEVGNDEGRSCCPFSLLRTHTVYSLEFQQGVENEVLDSRASGVRPRPKSLHDRQRTLSLAATWIPVQPAFVSGIYNTVYFKNTTSDNGPYTFFKPPQKQQSNMSEICNEDQEKENTFDYGLDTSFKPDECSNAGKFLMRAQKSAGSFQTFANSLEWMRQNYEPYNCTSVNLFMKKPIPFTYSTDYPAIQRCNVENILLRKRTISGNMTVTIYRVPSRTNNVPHKSPTGILHANESIDLPYGLAKQCYRAWNRRQKQKATNINSTIMVYLDFNRKNRVLHYTPTENVLVKEAVDFPYDSAFLVTQDSKNFELHSDTRGNKLETEPTTSVEGADFQDIHNDGMIDPWEENEDEDTPGCFNLGNVFRNMRKYFQKKYTRL
ncbi:hypothetical protein NDU88_007972 [Pleurodeles waltl]|uniref:Uncharacterized protein n=1 Tax=Pleurodeles waltl TaxID=8319 RepID=A0AAV7PVD6_PLEWA|nr:hypothetical protein NDU88_007972 [Pleurodeles waltl]